jgi:SAM-dependent methyltransferase
MAATKPPTAPASRFHDTDRSAVRAARPWDRLAYIVKRLPLELETLSRELQVPPDGRVLDYGCADMPYRRFFPDTVDYVGADLPGNDVATVELRPDGTVPVPDRSFDAVLSTQVLEHVEDPALYLSECARVLRPGGRLLLSTHGLMVYHPDPVDYWRWTCAGLRRAVEEAELEVVRFRGIMGLAATGFQMVQDAWYWRLPRPLAHAFALIVQTLVAVVDRVEPAPARDMNALVFALVARRP